MSEEFNLSKKIEMNCESISHHNPDGDRDADFILVEDVKEFIKRLKEKMVSHFDTDSPIREFIDDDFKELAGEKLI